MYDTYFLKNIFLYGIFSLLVIKFLVPIYEWIRQRWMLRNVPGPKGVPFFGIVFDMMGKDSKEIYDIFDKIYCGYEGGLSSIWIGFRPYINVYKANMIEPIITSNKHIEKGDDYHLLQDWLGLGLLTSGGKLWQTRRKLITPTFHFQILNSYIEVFNNHTKKLMCKIEELADGNPINVLRLITCCTLDAIMETAMGVCINSQEGEGAEYFDALSKQGNLLNQRLGKPWLRSNLGLRLFNHYNDHVKRLNILHSMSLRAIKERKEQFINDKKNYIEIDGKRTRLSFMDLLLEKSISENLLNENDIREEVDTFMFEGHDTTTSALSFCLHAIGCHPEYQKKIQEELDVIFGDSDRMPTMDDLKRMNYLECCLKESLRIFPAVPGILRKLNEDCVIGGYKIPRGTNINISIKNLHMDPEVFTNPDQFLPERFYPENCEGRSPYAYIPFSAGPRNCIGQKFALFEAKTILSSIFRKFIIESEETIMGKEYVGEMVIRPLNGKINIKFHRR